LLFASVAQAGWLSPVGISEAGEHIGTPQVVLDSEGNATAVWDRWNGTETVVESAYRPAGEGWQAPTDLSEPSQAGGGGGEEGVPGERDASSPRIAVDADGDTTVIWERYTAADKTLLQATYRPAGGSWEAPLSIGELKTGSAPEPWVAVDSQGDVTALWQNQGTIESAYRPAGGGWEAPVSISSAESGGAQAAVSAQGDATAVWMHFDGSRYVVQSAYRPAGGGWEAPTVLSEPGERGGDPHIALDAHGDSIVLWRGESAGIEVARAAYKPAKGSWQSPANVSKLGEGVQEPRVALDANGDAIAAWSASSGEGGGYATVQAAYLPAGGSWEAPIDLSEGGENAYPADLVFDTSGNAALIWQRSNGKNNIAEAAYRPTGGSWEAPVDVSEEGKDASDAVVVLDAPGDATTADGDATAVWTSDEGTSCGRKCEGTSTDAVMAAGFDTVEPPSEVVDVPATGTVGAPVEVSVPPQDIWSPKFEFGDGASAASLSATHTYSRPGKFTVTFNSTDVLGYGTSTQRIITISPNGSSVPHEAETANPSDSTPESIPDPKGGEPPPPSSSASEACAAAKATRDYALDQLRLTEVQLRRDHTAADARRLRKRSRRQTAALKSANRSQRDACGA